jgi:hypothetical protein
MRLFVGVIRHECGYNTYTGPTNENVLGQIADFCRQWAGDEGVELTEDMSLNEIIDTYFEKVNRDEGYWIDEHGMDTPADAYVEHMSRFTLPEEEAEGDVDEFIADLDDERLCNEYHTFMEMIREARKILAG